MIALAERGPQDWKPPIVSTVAYEHRGIKDLLEAVDRFRAFQIDSGRAQKRDAADVEAVGLVPGALWIAIDAVERCGRDLRAVEIHAEVLASVA